MRFLSQLFAFLYWSKERSFLGITVRGWLLWLLIALALATLLFSWPPAVALIAVFASAVLLLTYTVAGRFGYTRFFATASRKAVALPQPDAVFAPPPVEHRVPVRATGRFSVQDRELYLVEQPGEYWRLSLGQHVFMVQQRPGRFLYQIVQPSHLIRVTPGRLAFGKEPQEALAVYFRATWGPDSASEPRYYYATGGEREPEPVGKARKIYLTFRGEADRHAVWGSLLENSQIGAESGD